MGKEREFWDSPLGQRYASDEMKHIFSDEAKFQTWRELWVTLAESEKELGLNITDGQIAEMKKYVDDINYDVAEARESVVRHDVMSHVYAFGQQAKSAEGIIHLGATSCYVTDNTDLIKLREAANLIKKRLLGVIKLLADNAEKHKEIPTLGYTHFQSASPVTVGRREAMWLQNFVDDLEDLEYVISKLKALGCRGATGTSSTFMDLFERDEEKVKMLDKLICEKIGFEEAYPISGQTYPRTVDVKVTNVLQSIAVSAMKMAKDLRLLQHDKEMEEPFGKKQIGSSAMAYKRNPMRAERITSLARYVINQARNPVDTACDQWLERTLDDSANRRMSLSEAFLATDAMLIICGNVVDGLVVYNKVIEKHLREELPFLATENIIMEAAKKGGDRQELHEHIREHSMATGQKIKMEGGENDLLERIANDPIFQLTIEEVRAICNPSLLVGRCPSQVTDYLESVVRPILERNKDLLTEINTTVKV